MSDDIFIVTQPEDPIVAPIIDGLFAEYEQRYGDFFGERESDPPGIYQQPHGIFIALLRRGVPIATGAFKRYDSTTAEIKRVWTDSSLRRQGLAGKVMQELEQHARRLGYQHFFLTTGFRQPEAVNLYLSHGYTPQFDIRVDPATYSIPPYDGRLPFKKALFDVVAPQAARQTEVDLIARHLKVC
ncbi:acetyltransferase [Pectobacterium brasiliense]|uniref:GNAT family N-acetyltransferase n=1 Tax=Pectobacterium brasiliense TaxID=180957 RepID=UPI0004E638F2|nr:GNAT family N-acetyltransferase [Pectobacterium brasiliense]KFF62556.1 acetyltransferase [Pectobacterium brasiliense]